MYRIIGADQKEYGPVPADRVRKWIAEGRADGATQARAEGDEEWKPLSVFSEFSGALAARAAAAPSLPPKIGAAAADRIAADILARDYRVDIGDCFSRSWNLVRDNFWLLVGATAVVLVIDGAAAYFPTLGIPLSVLISLVLQGGLQRLFLMRLRGQPAEFGEVFSGFTLALVPLLLAGIVVHLLVAIGLAFCVLPGIYLLVAWRMFVPLLILDQGLEFWPAMELSRKVVTRHWWACFGLLLLMAFVGFLGTLACGVGIFFTMPIAIGAAVYAYEDIFRAPRPSQERLAPPPPEAALPPTPPESASGLTPPAPAGPPPPPSDGASAAPLPPSDTPAPPEAPPAPPA